ncbi:hypothetical protein BN874_2900007 [Candidatus Contendobacter odensis Run_B_J11]|uniref:Uncharacterized protein n=1 Tax=Candidatus Contendobacter odensis Run_B_J11 TaxID=1400861 RepID=A0A7U7J435_9GAMM|nr:hypothetical protein BN874_2900007 [Candidatus Contendobacter odensis Run_B_J11]
MEDEPSKFFVRAAFQRVLNLLKLHGILLKGDRPGSPPGTGSIPGGLKLHGIKAVRVRLDPGLRHRAGKDKPALWPYPHRLPGADGAQGHPRLSGLQHADDFVAVARPLSERHGPEDPHVFHHSDIRPSGGPERSLEVCGNPLIQRSNGAATAQGDHSNPH